MRAKLLAMLFSYMRRPLFYVDHVEEKNAFRLVPNRVWVIWCILGWLVSSIPLWSVGAPFQFGLIIIGAAFFFG